MLYNALILVSLSIFGCKGCKGCKAVKRVYPYSNFNSHNTTLTPLIILTPLTPLTPYKSTLLGSLIGFLSLNSSLKAYFVTGTFFVNPKASLSSNSSIIPLFLRFFKWV